MKRGIKEGELQNMSGPEEFKVEHMIGFDITRE